MTSDHPYASLWRGLRSHDTNLSLRLGASVALGALLGGLAVLGGFAVDVTGIGAHLTLDLDESVFATLLLATVVWLASLWFIWNPVRHARLVVRPIIGTLIIAVFTLLGVFIAAEIISSDAELVLAGLVLCGGALVVFMWLAALQRLIQGRSVIGPDRQVDVHCPSCGYSLIGLRELRCPECGTRFTIDELIRAQDYARPQQQKDTVAPPESTPQIPEPEQHAEA